MSKIDYKKLECDRNELGNNPKCPDCNSELGDSIIIPYYMVCPKCAVYWNPNLKTKTSMKRAWSK